MGLALIGVTHCRECHRPLKWNEAGICEQCENKLIEEYENMQKKEQEEKEKVLEIFYNMNKYEQKALEEFIHKLGKEYKGKETEKEIERLQKELEN